MSYLKAQYVATILAHSRKCLKWPSKKNVLPTRQYQVLDVCKTTHTIEKKYNEQDAEL